MASLEISPNELIKKAAEGLKKDIKMPDWAAFVKTGAFRERIPDTKDWWYHRAAAILRKIYIQSPIGVNKLSVLYGGKKNMGVKPERFMRGSRKLIRVILQQLEKSGYIQQVTKGTVKGRTITKKGKSFLDKIAK